MDIKDEVNEEVHKQNGRHEPVEGSDEPTLLSLAVIDKPVAPDLALKIIHQVAQTLQDASRSGHIHRNLRPSTILIEANDLPAVLDFEAPPPSGDEDDDFAYASPEQVAGLALDSRSNIYTLGIVLYELLFDSLPDEPGAPLLETEFGEDGRPEFDESILRIIDTCCKEQPWARYQNYSELLTAVDRAIARGSVSGEPAVAPIISPDPKMGNRKTGLKRIPESFSLNNRLVPIAAIVLFLIILAWAMINSWNQNDFNSTTIHIFDQIPLLLGGENSPARQTAEAEEAMATVRAMQLRFPTRTITPTATIESETIATEEPVLSDVSTASPTETPSATPTSTVTDLPAPPPTETDTPTPPPTNTSAPIPTFTATSPPPPAPSVTPSPLPTANPTDPPPPTEPPLPTPTPPPPPTPTPPIIPTSTPPPTETG